ncbi:MAG TPA: DUF2330 domain-containing protein [Acidimicrobiales bacterium]|nr:DUF2330 domain-containing protein [Acidimicrobiales bacterium]
MRKVLVPVVVVVAAVVLGAGPALACGGLIGRNGTVTLVKTTTLAAYHDGVEHYVTSFRFAGPGGAFGSIVPLPGVPTAVERGGKWTLQRLVREVAPKPARPRGVVELAADAAAPAEVLLETRVDALDLTVLKGGGASVGEWAAQNGFNLSPDAPEVLDFYASRSPIFLAARFDADSARERGLTLGDGIPIHLTIPTSNPWVPLRILGLGRQENERVDADVFLLTDRRPALLPGDDAPGLSLARQERASDELLRDLRSDDGMGWVPGGMWLSYLKVAASPDDLTYDLAVDVSGADRPSRVAAGLAEEAVAPGEDGGEGDGGGSGLALGLALAGAGVLMIGAAAVVLLRTSGGDAA